MSNYPAKLLPFYLVVALIFISIPVFSAQNELTEMQKQAIIYRQQGWQLQQQGKIEEALSYYQKAIVLDPSYVVAYNDAGIVFEAIGYPEQAKEMYRNAIKIDPDYPNSYSNLALLCEAQKDYTHAIIYWIKRATLGGSQDTWAEAARRRLENIARAYPEAYRDITERYKENLEHSQVNRAAAEGLGLLPAAEPKEVNLFNKNNNYQSKKSDNKSRALQHLGLAKQSFAQGQYVAALKEATLAEYFDSSNAEISAFVQTIRKKLLE